MGFGGVLAGISPVLGRFALEGDRRERERERERARETWLLKKLCLRERERERLGFCKAVPERERGREREREKETRLLKSCA